MAKSILVLALLLITFSNGARAQKIIKAELVFKGIINTSGEWQLSFADRKSQEYFFSISHSNTAPYIFCSTAADGSLKENEKIKDTWFLISYMVLKTDKTNEKIITQVKLITGAGKNLST